MSKALHGAGIHNTRKQRWAAFAEKTYQPQGASKAACLIHVAQPEFDSTQRRGIAWNYRGIPLTELTSGCWGLYAPYLKFLAKAFWISGINVAAALRKMYL